MDIGCWDRNELARSGLRVDVIAGTSTSVQLEHGGDAQGAKRAALSEELVRYIKL